MKIVKFLAFASAAIVRLGAQSACLNFPTGFQPFSSIYYVTAANYAGDHLVVGAPASGAINQVSATVPPPASLNQTFCDTQVQLAQQQFYSTVYVPTAAELSGNFAAFAGLLVDPKSGQPYPNGVIPSNQLSAVFAWRIGAAQTSSPNRGWTTTGSMTKRRIGHQATLLPDGKVLVIGADATSEIYDPATGGFTAGARMAFPHGSYFAATPLADGRTFIIGGSNRPSAAEIYDPASGTFAAVGSPVQPHGQGVTATLLNDGRVLIVGGLMNSGQSGAGNTPAGAELYDPQAGKYTPAGSMAQNRNAHQAILLADGEVLICGGFTNGDFSQNSNQNIQLNTAEVYSPSTGKFSAISPMTQGRGSGFAVLMPNGKILVGGGDGTGGSAELFDPKTQSFAATGSMSSLSRAGSQALLLSNGQVLVAGGINAAVPYATQSTELYDPAAATFAAAGAMNYPRVAFTATTLLDGRILVTGGCPDYVTCVSLSSAEIYSPVTLGLITSQSGLSFRFAQGNTSPQSQTISVLSAGDPIPWSVSAKTYQGGNWLSVSASSGTSTPGSAPVPLTISVNPAGLAAQDYYGSVVLSPTDGKHPPVSVAIVLNIVPAGTAAPPVVAPTGILFTGPPGATLNTRVFTISNLTSSPLKYTATASNTPQFFSVSPTQATIAAGQTTSLTVTPNITNVNSGVYRGAITLAFGDGSTQAVSILAVLSPGAVPSARQGEFSAATAAACNATKLLPIFTLLSTGFTARAAWPAALAVKVVDDCGALVNSGSVILSFTNGDPPISLISTANGNWEGTWVPQHAASGFTVRADTQFQSLTGTVQVSGQVSSNPAVPAISPGGIVSSFDYASAPAPGLTISIFGSGLADSAIPGTFPLPTQLGTTSVVLGTQLLPLYYVSDSVINVQIPYDVLLNTSTQIVVLRGNAVSVPLATAAFRAAPAVLSVNGTGAGQGHIYKYDSNGNAFQANPSSPASAGDVVVIYCVGL
ncbi:MAG: hypothetical protein LAO79_15610, partial [Acidobacteriia bacterium]|nr:hypothetical protein [Terriglobia bacterium]